MLTLAVINARNSQEDTMIFSVSFEMKTSIIEEIIIKSVVCPGDRGELVITLMLLDED